MESINNLKEVATKAIWGDGKSGKEPISGVNGDVSKGEPYDAGNMETTNDTAPDETGTVPVETATSSATSIPSTNPTAVKDSSHLPGDSTKAQNDVRSPSDPEAHHENAAPKENVDDTGSGLDVGDNPDKLEGPGPRPIEQVAKEHGGNAGNSGSESSLSREESSDKKEDHEEGTGELYVKSSGLEADGGDFDAAAPGAGREADRLLEEKGVHVDHHEGGKKESADVASPKEKVSLKDKIKAKLHHRKEVTA